MTGLTDAERTALLVPCECGHTLNDHGSLCWTCGDNGDECAVDFEDLLCERLAPLLAAAEARGAERVLERVEALAKQKAETPRPVGPGDMLSAGVWAADLDTVRARREGGDG